MAALVPAGTQFADIGTDHAYLPVWLLQHGVIDRAVAADLRQGPLERAKMTAEKYGQTQRMEFRLCDGLKGIHPDEAETIAVAGMGGETIASILSAAPWTKEQACRLVLQPMSAQPELRRWLQENGYRIEREVLVQEGRTIYTIFLVGAGAMPELTAGERWAGRQQRGEIAPLRMDYLNHLLNQVERAISGLKKSSRSEDIYRLAEMEQVYVDLERMKKEWEAWQQ